LAFHVVVRRGVHDTLRRDESGGPTMFRLWAFAASAPFGLLVALALPRPPGDLASLALVAAAGALGAGAASLAARLGDDAPDRTTHVAHGASAGLVALPAWAAAAVRLGPPAWLWLALAAATLGLALWRASRASAPAPGPAARVATALAATALATLAVVAGSVAYGWLSPGSPEPDAALRAAAFDIDSRVPLRTPRDCAPRAAGVTTLSERGAAPRLGNDGATVWFEARADDGRFQVYRLAPGAAAVCWTCAEPGNNRRPAPHPTGSGVLFDTDRFASWRSPAETEVMLVSGRGADAPRHPARRVTYSPGPDDHALYDPSGAGLVWTHGGGGRFEVRRASILSGHGGLLLSDPVTLFRGRSAWTAPLAWSADGRTLVAGFGQPLATLAGVGLDPASGDRRRIPGGLVTGSVSFSADGRVMAVASSDERGAARLLPGALGNVVARWPTNAGVGAEGTRVALGATDGERSEVDLGELASWGVPTGLALLPDASGFVLGQRGAAGERIVRVELDCAP
jgi:hypothetical protein